ncbi:MAG: EcsC family protein [Lentimicrobiaceae bacterium]|nr:EcsC family protein [Lentimicrobiaceae bacterium]
MQTVKVTDYLVMQTLDWVYEKVASGIAGMDTASAMATHYISKSDSRLSAAKALIRRQNLKAGSSGFITGLGGAISMPITIPLNLASAMYIQIRMIAAIAIIGGYDLRDQKVKSLIFVCLAGNFAKDLIKEAGIAAGTRITSKLISNISEDTLKSISKKTGIVLATKSGKKGMVNLSKVVPIAGGLIAASIDALATNLVGKIAIRTFIYDTEE